MRAGNEVIVPWACSLELTPECNHNCLYCSAPWSDPAGDYDVSKPFSAPQWAEVIEHLVTLGVRDFMITGGEPTLLPGFDTLIDHLSGTTWEDLEYYSPIPGETRMRRMPVSFEILTNGDTDAWTPDLCGALARASCQLGVHMAGPPEVHEAVTGGNFDRTLRTIELALAAGLVTVVNIPIFSGNAMCAPGVVQDLLEIGIRDVNVMRTLPLGRMRGRLDLVPSPLTFKQVLRKISSLCRPRGATCNIGDVIPYCALPPWEVPRVTRAYLCSCGEMGFAVDPQGRIRPCTCSPLVGGSVVDVRGALGSELFRSFTCRELQPKCLKCRYQDQCSGGCPAAWIPVGGSSARGQSRPPHADCWVR